MVTVSLHQAKAHFSQLIRRVAGGEEIVIARAGEPVARLVPIKEAGTRRLGTDEGAFKVPDDFDAPLPPEVLDAFDG